MHHRSPYIPSHDMYEYDPVVSNHEERGQACGGCFSSVASLGTVDNNGHRAKAQGTVENPGLACTRRPLAPALPSGGSAHCTSVAALSPKDSEAEKMEWQVLQ